MNRRRRRRKIQLNQKLPRIGIIEHKKEEESTLKTRDILTIFFFLLHSALE
jgi:hypothetical protein